VHSIASEDTEITLGVGKLLGLFFLLAAICGIFFSIGYSLGKSSGREQALNDQPAATTASADTQSSTSGSPKPSAALNLKQDNQAPTSDDSSSAGQQGSLTFYNAVKQNNNAAPANGAPVQSAAATPAPKVVEAAATAAGTKTEAAPAGAVISHTSPVTGPGTIVVQIAAVSREDDAVSLAGALRKKNYNVFVVNNPVTNDKFYHVQVGPFSNMADAEAMKAKLVAEGYNPIIKR
jgi:DedD protein